MIQAAFKKMSNMHFDYNFSLPFLFIVFNSYPPYLFDLLQQPIDRSIMGNSRSSTIHKEDGYSLHVHPISNLSLVDFVTKIIYELT